MVWSTQNTAWTTSLFYSCWCVVCRLYICRDGEPSIIVSWVFKAGPIWAAPWYPIKHDAGRGGTGSAFSGQFSRGAAGHENSSSRYREHGGSEGFFANPTGYGAVGGRAGSGPNDDAGVEELRESGNGYMVDTPSKFLIIDGD